MKCKSAYAGKLAADGTTTVTKTMRVTSSQDWPAYNAAQTHEKTRVTELLRGLSDGIVQPHRAGVVLVHFRMWSSAPS